MNDGADISEAHYYNIDGYDGEKFHFNKGWKGKGNEWNTLNGFKHFHNRAMVGISPIYNPGPEVLSVNSGNISDAKEYSAKGRLEVKNIKVNNGGELVLLAGDSVVLGSGVEIDAGATLLVKTIPELKKDKSISCSQDNYYISPVMKDGINDYVSFSVSNADSWECTVIDRNGKRIWASAGLVENGKALVWDGSSVNRLYNDDYWLEVLFKNNYGGALSKKTHVTYSGACYADYTLIEGKPLYLNCPNSGVRYKTDSKKWTVSVYDRSGKRIWQNSGETVDSIATVWQGEHYGKGNLPTDVYYLDVEFDCYSVVSSHSESVSVSNARCPQNDGDCGLNYELAEGRVLYVNCPGHAVRYKTDAAYWSASVYDRNGKRIWRGSGNTVDGIATVWSGEHSGKGKLIGTTYWLDITFECGGRSKSITDKVLVSNAACKRISVADAE